MKNILLLLLSVCIIVLGSCNHSQHETNSTDKHIDTTVIKCIKLVIKVVDDRGNICKNYKVKYFFNLGDTLFSWKKLPIDTFVHLTTIWSNFLIKGEEFETIKSLTYGIDRDTTLIFKIKSCN